MILGRTWINAQLIGEPFKPALRAVRHCTSGSYSGSRCRAGRKSDPATLQPIGPIPQWRRSLAVASVPPHSGRNAGTSLDLRAEKPPAKVCRPLVVDFRPHSAFPQRAALCRAPLPMLQGRDHRQQQKFANRELVEQDGVSDGMTEFHRSKPASSARRSPSRFRLVPLSIMFRRSTAFTTNPAWAAPR